MRPIFEHLPNGAHIAHFRDTGDFAATYAAEAWLRDNGFSVGSSQRGAPRGIMLGDYLIAKWRGLRPSERDALHGEMNGDGRHGPIAVTIRANAPEAAKLAIVRALEGEGVDA